MDRAGEETLLRGRRLGLAAMGMFLGPVVLAIIGAMSFRSSYPAQFLGGVAGLVIGALAARAVARHLAPTSKEDLSPR